MTVDTSLSDEIRIRLGIRAVRMADNVRHLASLGPRHAGTEREHEAAGYVEDQFRQAGVQVRVDEVAGVNAWYHHETRVRIVEPAEQELTAVAILGSGPTPREGITAEVAYVGRGFEADMKGRDLAGKFVFRDPPRVLTLDNASEEDSPQGSPEAYGERGVAGFLEHARMPGRMTQTDLLSGPEGLDVPAVALTYEDGLYLKELIREWYAVPRGWRRKQEEPVKVWVYVDTESRKSHGVNVIGTIPGSELPDEKVLLVAHHDNAAGPGACDNATAVSINLECARVLSQVGQPKRTIEFCSVTGEEYGEFGSSAYVKKYVKDPASYRGCIVLDIIGNGDHLFYITESLCLGKLVQNSPWLNKYVERVVDDLGYMIESSPLEYASDDGPFILAGVPTTYLAKLCGPSWPWLHTYMDDFEVVDVNGLKCVADIVATTLWRLAND